MTYKEFLERKIDIAPLSGIEIDPAEVSPALKDHQRVSVLWALRGGRRGIFARFGLGKTIMQLEWCRLLQKHEGGQTLVVMPLNVLPEFKADAVNLLGIDEPPYCRTMAEVEASTAPIVLTNYERVRDGDIDPHHFTAVSLDEAATLRSFGSKTYQSFMQKFKGIKYKLTNTATPSPNRYKELIHYAGFLEIMDTGQSLTRFFKRDSTKANNLTLYPGREREFWIWCASWGLFLQKPSDLGFSDDGYALPPLDIRYHKLNSLDRPAEFEADGQMKLGHDAAMGLQDAAKEKRDSIDIRAAEVARIIAEAPPDEHFVVWHDLEDERKALKKAVPEMVDIYGSMELETREQRVMDFAQGRTRIFGTKKSLSGSGCNFQRHCHRAIFMGIDYEFNDFGHNPDDAEFFRQMDYLTPELLRTLKPGRVAAIHVKDRVEFANVTGLAAPTIEPFHADCIAHFRKHGFAYFGMITVVTDVVRENNQTYRLGWTEQCKDGTKMGVGCPEYILLFRKLPTDCSRGYADTPVKKSKEEYTRAQWQIDAHAFWRSSGDRPFAREDLEKIPTSKLQSVYRKFSRDSVYDYGEHVKLAESLDKDGRLPSTFMVVAPGSWDMTVWDDIVRMKTLNTSQSQRRQNLHVCPLQIDIVQRLIERYSNEGELVADPFAGLFTVPYEAVKMNRKGKGVELNPDYFRDGVGYLESADAEKDAPTLFDLLENGA